MAIQDRNLTAGTKLWARYKGEIHKAEVVEVKALPHGLLPKDNPNGPEAEDDPRLVSEMLYKLENGRTFNSPSAAATGITGLAANGWTFWTVGDPPEGTGLNRSSKPAAEGSVHPAPKPERRVRRGRQQAEAPADAATETENPPSDEPAAEAQPVTCGICGETFPNGPAATDHYYQAHGAAEQPDV